MGSLHPYHLGIRSIHPGAPMGDNTTVMNTTHSDTYIYNTLRCFKFTWANCPTQNISSVQLATPEYRGAQLAQQVWKLHQPSSPICTGCFWDLFTSTPFCRALCFPRSQNRRRNRGIGWWKQNLLFNAEYRGIWHNFTEMLFSCGRGTFVWGKLHRGEPNLGGTTSPRRPPPHRLSYPVKTM